MSSSRTHIRAHIHLHDCLATIWMSQRRVRLNTLKVTLLRCPPCLPCHLKGISTGPLLIPPSPSPAHFILTPCHLASRSPLRSVLFPAHCHHLDPSSCHPSSQPLIGPPCLPGAPPVCSFTDWSSDTAALSSRAPSPCARVHTLTALNTSPSLHGNLPCVWDRTVLSTACRVGVVHPAHPSSHTRVLF